MAAASEAAYVRGRDDIFEYLTKTLKERIMIFDGAMGTMIQVRGGARATCASCRLRKMAPLRKALAPTRLARRSTSCRRQTTAGSGLRITTWILREITISCR